MATPAGLTGHGLGGDIRILTVGVLAVCMAMILLGRYRIQVRGPEKVMMHLMFGVMFLFADQLLKITGC